MAHLSLGGAQLRLRLTNEFGAEPVRVGGVRVALRDGGFPTGAFAAALPRAGAPAADLRTRPQTDRLLTFDGRSEAVIPAGGTLRSDPVDLRCEAGADLVISIYLPDRTPIRTGNRTAMQENGTALGDVTAAPRVAAVRRFGQYLLLSDVAVRAPAGSTAVVAFGDSITCGSHTSIGANRRWPDLLARRMRAGGLRRGVLNAGIGGNRLLTGTDPDGGRPAADAGVGLAGVRRFDRDVLGQHGVESVIVLLGVNDLVGNGTTGGLTADRLIAGHRELIARARDAGLRIFGGTVLPFRGALPQLDNPGNQQRRAVLNAWIRGGGEYDGVIDFDAALRDRNAPSRLRPAYDSGDGLHPNDAGMAAMAAAVPLSFFA